VRNYLWMRWSVSYPRQLVKKRAKNSKVSGIPPPL
jgi:hypothetical protein